jgi:hypothetical protein
VAAGIDWDCPECGDHRISSLNEESWECTDCGARFKYTDILTDDDIAWARLNADMEERLEKLRDVFATRFTVAVLGQSPLRESTEDAVWFRLQIRTAGGSAAYFESSYSNELIDQLPRNSAVAKFICDDAAQAFKSRGIPA